MLLLRFRLEAAALQGRAAAVQGTVAAAAVAVAVVVAVAAAAPCLRVATDECLVVALTLRQAYVAAYVAVVSICSSLAL